MALQHFFDDASRVMTVIGCLTFVAIMAWTYLRSERDFAEAAALPFADAQEDDHV